MSNRVTYEIIASVCIFTLGRMIVIRPVAGLGYGNESARLVTKNIFEGGGYSIRTLSIWPTLNYLKRRGV